MAQMELAQKWRRRETNPEVNGKSRGPRVRPRTRVVGAFPDGQSALNLAAARLRHIDGTAWSLTSKKRQTGWCFRLMR